MSAARSRATILTAAILLAPLVTVTSSFAPTTAGAASSAIRVLACTRQPETTPSNYVLSCADANANWSKVVWSTWGTRTAKGEGILSQNDCHPNCSAGHFVSHHGSVTLRRVITTSQYGRVYSEAVFRYRDKGKTVAELFLLAT